MQFPTVSFLAFFALAFLLAIFLKRFRRIYKFYLLLISFIFYASWKLAFLGILVVDILINYLFNYAISTKSNLSPRAKKIFYVLGIIANVLFLGVFKYYNFFVDSLFQLLHALNVQFSLSALQLIVPIGISFYTFKAISHLVDVRKGKLDMPPLIDYANYISFFPQIASGPIARAKTFYEDLNAPQKYDYDKTETAGLIISGLLKKYTLSSFLFTVVDGPFTSPGNYSSLELLIAALAYACLIYVDFSGYSDLANAISNLLGFRLVINFNFPYKSSSLSEFWKRWHISLSEWLRDYLYIGLGGSRKGKFRKYLNLFLTMLIGGFWHGAGWTFIVWGALHGIGLSFSHYLEEVYQGVKQNIVTRLSGIIATFSFVTIGWIFFNSRTIDLALQYLNQLFSFTEMNTIGVVVNSNRIINLQNIGVIVLVLIIFNFFGERILKIYYALGKKNLLILILICIISLGVILYFGPTTVPPFIYFNF